MTLETFFQKFDQSVDAPGVVAKRRELVLELAIQGKLVQRRASDGVVDALETQLFASRAIAKSLLTALVAELIGV